MTKEALRGLAHQYVMRASEYWHAARVAKDAETTPLELFHPVGHLVGMAAELALKAFLLHGGLQPGKLRKNYGHQLKSLLIDAVKKGLEMPLDEARAVVIVYPTHYDHFFRYGWVDDVGQIEGARTLPDIGKCLTQVGNLVDRIAKDPSVIRNKFQGATKPFDWPPSLPVLKPVTAEIISQLFDELEAREKYLKDISKATKKTAS